MDSCTHQLLLHSLFAFLVVRCASQAGECSAEERSLLLDLKRGFSFPEGDPLASWQPGSNCCNWEGITCDPESSRIVGLHLAGRDISGNISSSLFGLTSLQTLKLVNASFNNISIPQYGFERLANLTYLNLSDAGFVGQIPIGISRLTRLVSLDLASSQPGGLRLQTPNLGTMVRNLSKLKELHLDWVDLSTDPEWSRTLSISLPSLEILSLCGCDLSGFLPNDFFAIKNWTALDLSWNSRLSGPLPHFPKINSMERLRLSQMNISGSLPESIGNLQYLTHLEVFRGGMITGVLPYSIGNLTRLLYLDLQDNSFVGEIPSSLVNLPSLEYMDLSWNYLNGSLPSFKPWANISVLDLSNNILTGQILSSNGYFELHNLRSLYLNTNSLSGSVSKSLFCIPNLEELDLSFNNFSGQLEEFLNPSILLSTVDLSYNHLRGEIPKSLLTLPKLKHIYLVSNNFNGTVALNIFQSRKNLSDIYLSDNKLSVQGISDEYFHTFPKLNGLGLASCNLENIPGFLRYQRKITHLDLSNNRISGSIPKWIWSLTLDRLNLSCNSFDSIEEKTAISASTIELLNLRSNKLQGPIPLPPPHVLILDYSDNKFSNGIPSNISLYLNYTAVFTVANNDLTGEIPPSICEARNLQGLDLSGNSLSGSIPPCLFEGSNSLLTLNLGGNQLRGTIPQNISEGCMLAEIVLHGNHLEGQLPRSLTNCNELQQLDIADNRIVDSFPFWLGSIPRLRTLLLRANEFHGSIKPPESHKASCKFWKMQIFDLSNNNFNGNLYSECFSGLKAMQSNSEQTDSTLSSAKSSTYTKGYRDPNKKFLDYWHYRHHDNIQITIKGQEIIPIKTFGYLLMLLDFSNNAFEGDIPEVISELHGLQVLNLSHNSLKGNIPPKFGNLKQLESLDLSENHLSGEIPQELTSLTFLSFLNLSDNNLVGEIPQAGQFSTFANTSFDGNQGLCGSPLAKQCGNAVPKRTGTVLPSESDGSSSGDVIWLALFTGLGYGMGIALVFVLQNVRWKCWKRQEDTQPILQDIHAL